MTLDEVVSLMRGNPQTDITINCCKKRWTKTIRD